MRYDGYEFKDYKNNENDSASLSNNSIWSIIEDHEGKLWIGTEFGGINCFDPQNEKFTRYLHVPEDPASIGNGYIMDIYEDKYGSIWTALSKGGINKLDRVTGKFTRYEHDPSDSQSISHNNAASFLEVENDKFFVATRGGSVQLFDIEKNQFSEVTIEMADKSLLIPKVVTDLVKDKNDNIWVSTLGTGLYRMEYSFNKNNAALKFHHHPINNIDNGNVIFRMKSDDMGTIWLATWGAGLISFNPKTKSFKQYNAGNGASEISNIYVHSLLIDSSGNLWVGTDEGLNKADLYKKLFWKISRPERYGDEIDFDFHRIYEDREGTIWIGSPEIWRLNERYTPGKKPDMELYAGTSSGKIRKPSGAVEVIYKDSKSNLWVGMNNDGLLLIDENADSFVQFKSDPNDVYSLSHNSVTTIHEDKKNILWVGTLGGGINKLIKLTDSGKAKFEQYSLTSDGSIDFDLDRIWYLTEDQEGMFWIGTRRGLVYYDPLKHEIIDIYFHDINDPESLGDSNINKILIDREGTVWVATSNGGLNKFNREEKKFTSFRIKEGLSSNNVTDLFLDNYGFIWLTTSKGFSRYDPETESIKNYIEEDGIGEGGFDSGILSKSGLIYMVGTSGITVFDPQNIKSNEILPKIELTEFSLFNKSMNNNSEGSPLIKNISYTDTLYLTHFQNVITFKFAALHYSNPARNKYAYKMEGFDNGWSLVEGKREATYTNLDPGKYIFKVKGSNYDGKWNEEGRSLVLFISPPWWQTWWAYLSYFLLITGIFISLRRYELNRQKYKHGLELEQVEAKKLKEIDTLKSRFFANISHEFRTPLTIILGQIESLISKSESNENIKKLSAVKRNGKRLLQLINQLLDLSKLEAKKMKLNAAQNDLIPFLKNIIFSFESLTDKRNINLTFESNTDKLHIYFEPEKLDKVFLNLISNAIKFTDEGGTISIEVNSAHSDRYISITVSDTGIGISEERIENVFDRFYQVDDSQLKEHEGTGIGLALAKEFVELHHGKISVESSLGKGTVFVILLPKSDEEFENSELAETSPLLNYDNESREILDAQPVETALTNNSNKEFILVVEDNNDIRTYIKDTLTEDFNIIEAVNGEEGLTKAAEMSPNLIITDVMMPKMDGMTLSKKIRNDEITSHIPIIMLTAKASDEDKITGLETGVDDYLIKPFNPKELLVRVKNILETRALLRRRFTNKLVIKPEEVSAVPADKKFMTKLMKEIEENLDRENYSVQQLSDTMGMSMRTLSRKVNSLINKSPSNLLRSMRLQKAAELLKIKSGNVAEIAYQTGFSDQAHFTKAFKREFNMSPGEYSKSSEN
jgi:signal transduction histidine kinase/ligand-binding sensor domain-containing protein/DNA-binding response OmpR family regulator